MYILIWNPSVWARVRLTKVVVPLLMNNGIEPRRFYRGVRYQQGRTYGSSDLNLSPRAKNKKKSNKEKQTHMGFPTSMLRARVSRTRGNK